MDIQLLKTFRVVARLGNITQAAEQLNFTQPAISAQIRTLEEHFGVPLFERIGKKLYITEAGSYLVEPAEKMLALYSETFHYLSSITAGAPTRIALSTNYINHILSPALLKLQAAKAAGTVRVEICANSKAVLQGLKSNQYDIGLVHDYIVEKNLDTVTLRSDELVWCGHKSILSQGERSKLTDYPIINFRPGCTFRKLCDGLLQKHGLTYAFEYSDFDAVTSAMAEGLGIALLPRVIVKDEREIVVLSQAAEVQITLWAITRQDKCLSSSVTSLLQLLQEP